MTQEKLLPVRELCLQSEEKAFCFLFFVVIIQSHVKPHSVNICIPADLSCSLVIDYPQSSRCTVLFGKEYQQQKCQYIRQDHHQILITAGHL